MITNEELVMQVEKALPTEELLGVYLDGSRYYTYQRNFDQSDYDLIAVVNDDSRLLQKAKIQRFHTFIEGKDTGLDNDIQVQVYGLKALSNFISDRSFNILEILHYAEPIYLDTKLNKFDSLMKDNRFYNNLVKSMFVPYFSMVKNYHLCVGRMMQKKEHIDIKCVKDLLTSHRYILNLRHLIDHNEMPDNPNFKNDKEIINLLNIKRNMNDYSEKEINDCCNLTYNNDDQYIQNIIKLNYQSIKYSEDKYDVSKYRKLIYFMFFQIIHENKYDNKFSLPLQLNEPQFDSKDKFVFIMAKKGFHLIDGIYLKEAKHNQKYTFDVYNNKDCINNAQYIGTVEEQNINETDLSIQKYHVYIVFDNSNVPDNYKLCSRNIVRNLIKYNNIPSLCENILYRFFL